MTVAKQGFTPEKLADITLRAGETATARVKLVASGGQSEVTVYGTTEGVRNDPELGTRLDATQIEETPLLGRKISYLPLLNAAFRNAKGTGDLFMNSIYVVAGAGGRREADYIVDGATRRRAVGTPDDVLDDSGGRGAGDEHHVARVLGRVRLDRERRREHRHQVGFERDARRGALPRPSGRHARATTFSADQQCPSSISTCVPPTTNGAAPALVPPDIPDTLSQGSFAIGGAIVKDRTQYFVAADGTMQDRTALDHVAARRQPGTTFLGHYRQALVDGRSITRSTHATR